MHNTLKYSTKKKVEIKMSSSVCNLMHVRFALIQGVMLQSCNEWKL